MKGDSRLEIEQYKGGRFALYQDGKLLYLSNVEPPAKVDQYSTQDFQNKLLERLTNSPYEPYQSIVAKLKSKETIKPGEVAFLKTDWEYKLKLPQFDIKNWDYFIYSGVILESCSDLLIPRISQMSGEDAKTYLRQFDFESFLKTRWDTSSSQMKQENGYNFWKYFVQQFPDRGKSNLEYAHAPELENGNSVWRKNTDTLAQAVELIIERCKYEERPYTLGSRLVIGEKDAILVESKKWNLSKREFADVRLAVLLPKDPSQVNSMPLEIKDITDASQKDVDAAIAKSSHNPENETVDLAKAIKNITSSVPEFVLSAQPEAYLSTNILQNFGVGLPKLTYINAQLLDLLQPSSARIPVSLRSISASELDQVMPPSHFGATDWCDVSHSLGYEFDNSTIYLTGRDYTAILPETTRVNAATPTITSTPLVCNSLLRYAYDLHLKAFPLLEKKFSLKTADGTWQTQLGPLSINLNEFRYNMAVLNADGTLYREKGSVPTQTITGRVEFNPQSGALTLHGNTYFYGKVQRLNAKVFYSYSECADRIDGGFLSAERQRQFQKLAKP